MADLLCTHNCIPISYIGCGTTRRALLGLEPGSCIWLEVEGRKLLFERVHDAADGSIVRVLKATAPHDVAWRQICEASHGTMIEVDFTERPIDAGRSGERWSDDDLPTIDGSGIKYA